jgi:hypothetical protein
MLGLSHRCPERSTPGDRRQVERSCRHPSQCARSNDAEPLHGQSRPRGTHTIAGDLRAAAICIEQPHDAWFGPIANMINPSAPMPRWRSQTSRASAPRSASGESCSLQQKEVVSKRVGLGHASVSFQLQLPASRFQLTSQLASWDS